LQVVVSATEASQEGRRIKFKEMKLVFFMGERSLFAAQKSGPIQLPGSKKADPKKADPKKEPKADAPPAAARTSFMPMGGRVVISAPEATLDTTTNEGRATGMVKIEIYQRAKPGEVERPMAVLSTQRLQWRTWGEPSIGSLEIAIYTAREKGETLDPLVQGYYEVTQPGERPSTMRVQGRGMIFESGTLDHLAPVYDDDGRLAGGSRIARNRALFRSDIHIEMTASTLSALMPFQAPIDATANAKPAAKKDDKAPPTPSLTQVACRGPAILDTAVVPYLKRDPNANLAKPNEAPGKEQLQPVLLARRFEFLNSVSMTRTPLDAEGKPIPGATDETRMSCGHLRIQLPALQPQGGFGLAEYVEAVGGVRMKGRNTAGAISGAGAPAPSQEFSMECERMYFDGPTGSMFLVGTPKQPAHATNPQFEASAHQFSYQMKSQDFAMPLKGPKRMVIRGGPPSAKTDKKDDNVISFTQGDTIITWNGPLLRKLVRLPVPGGADRVKEVLTFSDNVSIEQPTGSLRMKAGNVKVVRPSPEGAVEYLEGVGGVAVQMGDQSIAGEKVTVEMIPGTTPGKMEKDVITISGSRRKGALATLIKGGSAARSEKFVIDRRNDNFVSLGGTVAVVKREGGEAPEAPKPQAAQDAGGLFQGISLQPGGNLFIQCDGDFAKDGTTNSIRVQKNVIVRQPGLTLYADEVELMMDTAAATTAAPSGELFTADPQKIRCTGNIEVIAQGSQWVQCDELEYDVKTQRSTLKMKDPENDIRIYMKDEGGGTRVLCVRGSLELDGKSGKFLPGGLMLMLPYSKAAPSGRARTESPAHRKVQK